MVGLKNTKYSYVRGFNYQPSYASHGILIWGRAFDIKAIDVELGRGKKFFPRINTIRLWLSHDAFIEDADRFVANLESVLALGPKYDLRFIVTLFNGWHSVPDFGGVTAEQTSWVTSQKNNTYEQYLRRVVPPHIGDNRIVMWDLCNEPFNTTFGEQATEIMFKWLKEMHDICKSIDPDILLTVGVCPIMDEVRMCEPLSDVISTHPYITARLELVPDKQTLEAFLDEVVTFANSVNKALLSTETGWGQKQSRS